MQVFIQNADKGEDELRDEACQSTDGDKRYWQSY